MGFTDMVVEKKVGAMLADLYSPSLDLVIEVAGPPHFRNDTMMKIGSSLYQERYMRHYHKHYIQLPYHFY